MPQRRNIATAILQIYKGQQARAGYVIPASLIAALSDESGWSADEVDRGLAYGYAAGWFADGPQKFLRLTDGGVAQLQVLPA